MGDIASHEREKKVKRWTAARHFEESDRVPVLINVGAPFFCQVLGYNLKDFYRNLELNLKIQLDGSRWAYKYLGDDRISYVKSRKQLFPNIGSVGEGIVWDCRISLPTEDEPWLAPWIIPRFTTPEKIEKLEIPDPKECVKRLHEHYKTTFGVCAHKENVVCCVACLDFFTSLFGLRLKITL